MPSDGKHPPWTDAERAIIRRDYRRSGPERMAIRLGRPYRAVAIMACRLGLGKAGKRRRQAEREAAERARQAKKAGRAPAWTDAEREEAERADLDESGCYKPDANAIRLACLLARWHHLARMRRRECDPDPPPSLRMERAARVTFRRKGHEHG